MGIEQGFDVAFVAALALREKQIQQNYRPVIAVHKWFARRPGALFRGLVLSEFVGAPLSEAYFESHDLPGKVIADPFMGGGTPILEANRVGADVKGYDVNPMAAWVCREEVEHLDLKDYGRAATALQKDLAEAVGDLYRTRCPAYGDDDVPVKYFLWVKVIGCEACGRDVDLFPGYLLAEDIRHPRNVLVCPECGELNEVADRKQPGACWACRAALTVAGPAKRGACACGNCGHVNRFPRPKDGPPRHRLFAMEYHNPRRKAEHRGRFFKKPDEDDLARAEAAAARWRELAPQFVPDDPILPGDETDRLHRWGYRRYREMFSDRQLLGLELSCRLIAAVGDERVRHALATNLSDLLRYQNTLCRYDTMALKSLDIFSVHGFPVGLVHVESSILGLASPGGASASIGSGGWANIVDKYAKAKRYCDEPFEIRVTGGRKEMVPIRGEWIGERRKGSRPRSIEIRCATSLDVELPEASLDAVLTDPPYYGMVQYGELMDFCYVWLRRLAATDAEGFGSPSARSPDELTGNVTSERDIEHFTEGLARVYGRMAVALKPGAPLAFTFHHNKVEAYASVAVAILDAGLICTASPPCPAEMGGSIHINGTGSSIVDTVFVCRHEGAAAVDPCENREDLAQIVDRDLAALEQAGMRPPSAGDKRCVTYGHLARLAIRRLRPAWKDYLLTSEKLALVGEELLRFGALEEILEAAAKAPTPGRAGSGLPLFERQRTKASDAISV